MNHRELFRRALSCALLIGSAAAGVQDSSAGQVPGARTLRFERNRGQAAASFEFVARGPDHELGLAAAHATLRSRSCTVEMELAGARPDAYGAEQDVLGSRTSYFRGSDPARWIRALENFARVRYAQAWPGVDVVYYGRDGRLEYDFLLAPGVDADAVRLAFSGAATIAPDGALLIEVAAGTLRQAPPVVYERHGETTCELDARWRVHDDGTVGFAIEGRDPGSELTIDPVIQWAALVGGSGSETARAVEIDATGRILVAGGTQSADFPGSGLQFGSPDQDDAYLLVLDETGTQIIESIYLGGTGFDEAVDIAIDPTTPDTVYLAGDTTSSDFPVAVSTSGPPFQSNLGGGRDAWVARIDLALSRLDYSTYLGGAGTELLGGIAVDSFSQLCVVGETTSTNFPVHLAQQPQLGGFTDGFLSKLDFEGDDLVWSTYVGGVGFDTCRDVAISWDDQHYVVGAQQGDSTAVSRDAFVQQLGANGAFGNLQMLGGSAQDWAEAVAVDHNGEVYVTGWTSSSDFPLAFPVQLLSGGGEDVWVAALNGTTLVPTFATYFGGSDTERAYGIDVDFGRVYVVGKTDSWNLPKFDWLSRQLSGESDAFIAAYDFTTAQASKAWSTYYPGGDSELLEGVAIDESTSEFVVVGRIESDWTEPDTFSSVSFGATGGQGDTTVLVAKLQDSHGTAAGAIGFAIAEDKGFANVPFAFYAYRDTNGVPATVAYEIVWNGNVLPDQGYVLDFASEQVALGYVLLELGGMPTSDFQIRLKNPTNGATLGQTTVMSVRLGGSGGSGGGGGGGDDRSICGMARIASGTPLADDLDVVRGFRDRVLTRFEVGRFVRDWYYESSPEFCRFVDRNEWLLPPLRAALFLLIAGLAHPLSALALVVLAALAARYRGRIRSRLRLHPAAPAAPRPVRAC